MGELGKGGGSISTLLEEQHGPCSVVREQDLQRFPWEASL